MTPLYPRILGEAFRELPERIRRGHEGLAEIRASGTFDVALGQTLIARALSRLGGLPRSGERVPTELIVTPDERGETWRRKFGGDYFVTRQWEEDGLLVERVSLFELRFRLAASNGQLTFEQRGAGVRLGFVHLRLPVWLAPHVSARVWEEGEMRVRVEVSLPGVGTLCRYEGGLEVEERS